MGGNALKPFQVRRVAASEYHALSTAILDKLQELFPSASFWIPKAYKLKESYGDIDIVSTGLPDDYVDRVSAQLNPKASFLNTNVYSFEYDGVQVDLIKMEQAHAHFTYRYFCYNDLGGLLHVLSKRLGFYIGQAGLQFKVYMDAARGQLLETIPVTYNFDEALLFLGLSPQEYAKGFDTLEDIFKFVASSPYFEPKAFLFENRNAHDRFRDQKRATYMAFLQWIETNNPSSGEHANKTDSTYQVLRAMAQFPDFSTRLQSILPLQNAIEDFTSRVQSLIGDINVPTSDKHPKVATDRMFYRYVVHKFDSLAGFHTQMHMMTNLELEEWLKKVLKQYILKGCPKTPRVQ